ncbi:hypothetical protein [Mesorhizobium shangrilense]|uniref:TonB-dependent receptor n=1 Tax=Mesorhizobium shangrilense TaxID=460060 RepID=A0ABV2D5Y0_9HYPH
MAGNYGSSEQDDCSETKPDRDTTGTPGLFAINTIRLVNADDLRAGVGLAVSAPLSVVDPSTRRNLNGQTNNLAEQVGGTSGWQSTDETCCR